jgi:hypothetical protein
MLATSKEIDPTYYETHDFGDEMAEAFRTGNIVRKGDYGCDNIFDALRAHKAAQSQSRKRTYTLTLTLPVQVMDTIKHRAEERHETEEEYLSDLILQAA